MFSVEIPPGRAALIRGPAEVECADGCRVFGGIFRRFSVPPFKQYPVEGPAAFKIDGGSAAFVEGPAVPQDWDLRLEGVVALVGPADSGKSGLSTYMLNANVEAGEVCVVDADVGQSDVGPPGFVSCACSRRQVPHISELDPADGYYVGSVNLQGVEEMLVAGVARCLRRLGAPRLVVINTPGWTSGRGVQMLRALADAADAAVVNLGDRVLPGLSVTRPRYVLPRSPQDRRASRNLSYRRHVRLTARLTAPADALSVCSWDGALSCPWGRYRPGDVEGPEGRGHDYVVPRDYLRHIFAGLYRGGRLAGYGVVEKIGREGVELYASTENFDEIRIGKIRLDPDALEELEPLP